jgi:hypothetical protein
MSAQDIDFSWYLLACRVQAETSDGAERNRYLVQYVDYAFDDFGGRHEPVYPGLCSVWRSLARSKVHSVFISTSTDHCSHIRTGSMLSTQVLGPVY